MKRVQIKRNFLILLLAAAVLAGGFGGWALGSHAVGNKYHKLEQLRSIIDSSYYEKTNDDKLVTQACKGLVKGLGDPYSEYMTKKETEAWKTSVLGEYEGVGMILAQNAKTKAIVVVSVVDASPAEKAGIRAGDIVKKVDDKHYEDVDDVAQAIRGTAGSQVDLGMERDGRTYTKRLTREAITMQTVETRQLAGKIGYIRLTSFEKSSADDFKKALTACEKKGNKGLIIDLRDNGGGLVDVCADIADELMGKGVLTYMEGQDGKRTYYRTKAGRTKLPYVLLVNGNTSSASEILTAAVMDNTDNKVVGTRTFGKGVVQDVMSFKDGTSLKLTVKQYFSPKGKTIHKKGITPDYVVKSRKAQLAKAEALLQ